MDLDALPQHAPGHIGFGHIGFGGGVYFTLAFLVMCGTYMFIRSRLEGDPNPPVGYTLGYRRADGVLHTKIEAEGTDIDKLIDWAERTSRRPDVAEAWFAYRTPDEGIVRWYWVDGQEDRKETGP
ncbi:hypothetical protein OG320_15365 [Microbispora sp. NBC_01189]|uniref:hypothetical protein n=1 Tax=Microbispora sp. NBC_01189 TaxID=2903583 RepID=UPI002E167CDE|nr:hypothetical protein OG320_15365 [Microbispora sp. NBC_01189]